MNKRPTPQVHPAYQALYGKPAEKTRDSRAKLLELFRKLSTANQSRALEFAEALAAGDQQAVERMQKELEIETAYLQQSDAEQLESDLLSGRTPKQLRQAIQEGLNSKGGAL